MFRNPEPSPMLAVTRPQTRLQPGLDTGWRLRRLGVTASLLISSVVLASCSSLPWNSARAEAEAAQNALHEQEARAIARAAASAASSLTPPPPAPPVVPSAPDAVARVLMYAERVRTMPPAELNQELLRLAAPGEANVPASQVQLSLALSQLRQLPELIRGQELLARVLANAGPDAQPLHPLARLLAFRYGEQRRLEDQLEKERQQTREVQRRLDQTNERLEALKAIERSLTTRAPAPATAAPNPTPAASPASRGRANP